MHSYYNKLPPNHFDDYFIPISSIISTPQDYPLLTTRCYLESTLFQENDPLHLLAQKCDLQYQTVLSFLSLLPSNGNLRNTSYMKKIHNYII